MSIGDKVWFRNPNDYWRNHGHLPPATATAFHVDKHGTKWVEMTFPNGGLHYAPVEDLKVVERANVSQ